MLEKHVQSFNSISQNIESWISHKHNNSEVKYYYLFIILNYMYIFFSNKVICIFLILRYLNEK